MKRIADEEIKAIEDKKNAANVAGLLMVHPLKPDDEKEDIDNVQSERKC